MKGFVDGVVLVKMKGSCKGCSSSSITLKGGIERLLQHYVPEVIEVMAVEDDDVSLFSFSQPLISSISPKQLNAAQQNQPRGL